ncbi:MAG: ABC transporter permease [SAR324 cluster bacterium]|nr:ABC transporter permease [SAR324 cluster bacterium]
MTGRKKILIHFFVQNSTIIVFIVIFCLASFSSDVFLSNRNITNLLRQVAALSVVSFGMLLVVLTGGIDLSVGSVMAVASVTFALANATLGFFPSLFLTLLVCLVMGMFSGFMVAKMNMAPFIATLAMMIIGRGVALNAANGSPIQIKDPILTLLGRGYIGAIPVPVFAAFVTFVLLYIMLHYTAPGRIVIAVGSNEKAVNLTGIKVDRYKMLVYSLSGVLAGMGGVLTTSRTSVGSPILAEAFELDAIAAVVIGGASLAGGKGRILNTLFGVVILGTISNIMNLKDIPGYNQLVVKGLIIVIAVYLQGIQLSDLAWIKKITRILKSN